MMRPETVHLLAMVLRHTRGMCTAFEHWLETQSTSSVTPPQPASPETVPIGHNHPRSAIQATRVLPVPARHT